MPRQARQITAHDIQRDYAPLAQDYEQRWRTFNAAVRRWVLARWQTHVAPGARVLDLGCGTGGFLKAAAASDPDLTPVGLDLTPALLAEARRAVPHALLVQGDAQTPPFTWRSFDVVCSLNVLHHINDPAAHIAAMARLCRPRGTAFMATFAGKYTFAMRAADWWLRFRNPAWRRMLSTDELRGLLHSEPRFVVAEQNVLRGGSWWLQVHRMTAVD
jgi:ubiquinone/menaquinone biosynthesis C-methylase UbiE